MTINDPVADLLTRIRNGAMARQRYIEVPKSKLKVRIIEVLKELGFIQGFLVQEEIKGVIRVYLKYGSKRRSVINGLQRVSKPSCRKYVESQGIPKIFGGMGDAILSTSKGIMVGKEARRQKVGGEVLCYVW